VGGAPLAHTNGLFTALAVNTLNAVLGAVGQPGGMSFTPQAAAAASAATTTLPALIEANPQVLLVDGANPVFTAPQAWKVAEAFARVPFIASFGSFLDETSVLADLILPDHSFLESWVDALPESGSFVAVASVAPPAMQPLHQTRATADVLLEVARTLATPLNLPWMTYDEMLGSVFGDGFTAAQEKGWAELSGAGPTAAAAPTTAAPAPAAQQPSFDGDAQQYPFHFLPYPSSQFRDGSVAHLPWLQEMPDPLTSAMWSSWVELNPQTAARLGIADGDVLEIASTQGTVRAPAAIFPGIAPDVVAMPIGQGHQTFTRYASGRGDNAASVIAPLTETATGALAWAATRVKVTRVAEADGSLILFAGGMREEGRQGR
jgi:anaerobic selenocysteine-containing dehydrogenase